MEEVTTLFDSDEAEYEYMKEQEAKRNDQTTTVSIATMAKYEYGVSCLLCDSFIKTDRYDTNPRVCEKCKKAWAEIRNSMKGAQ